MTARKSTREHTPRVIIDRRSDRVYVKPEQPPEEGRTLKSWLLGAAQAMVPLAIMAVISVTRMQSVTETQVSNLEQKVLLDVNNVRKQIEASEVERRAALNQFQSQAMEVTKIGERMSVYLAQQENINKEIRDRLQYIERYQRGGTVNPPSDRR